MWWLCLCLVPIAAGCSEEPSETPLPVGTPADTRIPDQGAPVPIQWAAEFPVVSVMVNDQGPYWCIVDTGTTALTLSPKVVGDLPHERSFRVVDSAGRGKPSSTVMVRSLRIGEAEFAHVEGVVLPLDELPITVGGEELSGVIGIRTFRDCRITLDFPRSWAIIQPLSEEPLPGDVLPLQRHEHGLPTVHVPVGDIEYTFTIDTGSNAAISMPAAVASRLDLGPVLSTTDSYQLHGTRDVQRRVLNGSVRLGPHRFTSPTVSVGRGQSAIGIPLLRLFTVTIDQASESIAFGHPAVAAAKRLLPQFDAAGDASESDKDGPKASENQATDALQPAR